MYLYFIPGVTYKSVRVNLHRRRESGAEISVLRARELRGQSSPTEGWHHAGGDPRLWHHQARLPGGATTVCRGGHYFIPLTVFFLLLSSNYSFLVLIPYFLFVDCCNPPNPPALQA